jgi:RHS repeat-associated protein
MYIQYAGARRVLAATLLLFVASGTSFARAATPPSEFDLAPRYGGGSSPAASSASAAADPLPVPVYDATKVANPTANVSAGTTAMGATPAHFAVSPSGAATYSIPLQVIPNPGGLQPSLSIDYSSSAGNGPLGAGFSLGGVLSITRCPRIAAEDGEAKGVQLDDTDRFCLGGRKLVAVSGVYGADGTEYRTLPDTQVRVRSYRDAGEQSVGPTRFVVDLPNGTTQYFGRDSWPRDDRVQTISAGKKINLAWPLLGVRNGSGHAISYYYASTKLNGHESERWLTQIHYGSNQILLGYEDRPDKSFGYLYGGKRESTMRLKTVTMLGPGGMTRARSYTLEYHATTSGTGRSRLASVTECGIVETECLRPTRFTWSYSGAGFQTGVKQTMPLPSDGGATIVAADLNGDGRTDFAYPEGYKWKYALSHPSPTNGNHYSATKDAAANLMGEFSTAYPIDWDLDGKTDLLQRHPVSTITYKCSPLLSRGSDGGTVAATTPFDGPLCFYDGSVTQYFSAHFGDFNGDGLQDVLEHEGNDNTGHTWKLRLRTGLVSASVDANPAHDSAAWQANSDRKTITALKNPNRMMVLDLNADGRDEVIFDNSGTVKSYDPITDVQKSVTGITANIFSLDIKLADLNGDGLIDLVTNGAYSTTPGSTLHFWLNKGRGFLNATEMSGFTVSTTALKAAQVIDINADGRFELLVPRLSSGANFEPVYTGMDLVQSTFNTNAPGDLVFTRSGSPVISFPDGMTMDDLERQGTRVIDADGDGGGDVVAFDRADVSTSSSVMLFRGDRNTGDRVEFISEGNQNSQLTTGVQPTVRVYYAPLTDSGVYAPGNCARIIWMSCATGIPMNVVKRVERDSGLSGTGGTAGVAVTDYRYTGGRFDKKTQGFAGFAEILATSYGLKDGVATGLSHRRSFYTNTIVGKMPQLIEEWTFSPVNGPRDVLARTTYYWSSRTVGPTYFEYVSQTQRRQYEFPELSCNVGACLKTMTPDAFDALGKTPHQRVLVTTQDVDPYGNVLHSQTMYGPGTDQLTVVNTTYDIDTANWLLRRPKTVTTTDYAPSAQTRTVEYTYGTTSADRHLIKQEKRFGSATKPGDVLTVDYEYDARGSVTRETIADVATQQKRETTYAYDPYGYPHAVRNALGHTSYTGYDPTTGKLKIARDANGLRTDYTYDTLGRLRTTRHPDGVEQHVAYSLQTVGTEKLVQVEQYDATGAKSQQVVDRGGRPMIERARGFDGVLRESTRQYDPLGRLIASATAKRQGSAEPVYTTTYSYDNLGRLTKTVEPGNAVRSVAYDKLTTTHTNTRGHKTRSVADQRGQTVSTTDGLGTPDETTRIYTYGPFGTLANTSVVGVANSTSSFVYDLNGRLSSTEDERGYTQYEHNAFGEMTSQWVMPALETTFAYDVLGRLDAKTVKDNGVVRSVLDHTYDSVAGRTTLGALLRSEFTDQIADGHKHTTNFWFDTKGRLQFTDSTMRSDEMPTVDENFRVARSYDNLGRLYALEYPMVQGQNAPTKVFYEYAPAATSNGQLSRIKAVENLQGASAAKEMVLWTAEASDEQNRLNGWQTGDGLHTTQAYDWRGLTTNMTVQTDGWDDQGDVTLAKVRFSYDGEANLVTRADDLQAATEAFGYDALNRLTASSMKSTDPFVNSDDRFSYDKLGNLVSSTRRGVYTFDPVKPTQVVAVSGGTLNGAVRTYGYDSRGNQTMRPEGKVEYNDFDLPARFANKADVTTASFLYDAAGQRVRKTTPTASVTYVPGLYERHRKPDGTVEHRLVVPDAGATLRYTRQSGNLIPLPVLYTHGDNLGSTALVTQTEPNFNGIKAVVAEKRSYESFGLPRNPDWKAVDVFGGIQRPLLDQGYTGHDEDREMELINMKGRIYDSKLGRFLTPDPFVDGANPTQRWNRYAYVSNNPLSYNDPTGFRMNLEAIKERVEANATSFAWAAGTIEGNFASDFDKLMSGHTGAGEFQPVGIGSATYATDAWYASAAWAWASIKADGCMMGCTQKELERLWNDFADDYNLPKVKHPAKEGKPATDGSVSGNDSSGQSDGALDEPAPSDPIEEWATNGDTLSIGVEETDPLEEWATSGDTLVVDTGEVPGHKHTPKPHKPTPPDGCVGPDCGDPEPPNDCLGPSCVNGEWNDPPVSLPVIPSPPDTIGPSSMSQRVDARDGCIRAGRSNCGNWAPLFYHEDEVKSPWGLLLKWGGQYQSTVEHRPK